MALPLSMPSDYVVPVDENLKATTLDLSPKARGTNRQHGAHMRAFWGATVSFFLAFIGWFALAPVALDVAHSIGICENQVYPPSQHPARQAFLKYKSKTGATYCRFGTEGGSTTEPTDCAADPEGALGRYGPEVLPKCVCTPGTECQDTILYSAIGSVTATVMVRIALGTLLERWGPVNTQCALLVFGSFWVLCAAGISSGWSFILIRTFMGCVGATFVTNQFWCSLMFAPKVVGTANATAGGWGNLGGGVAQVFIVWCLFKPFQALGLSPSASWRLSMCVPAIMLLVCAGVIKAKCQDTPTRLRLSAADVGKKSSSLYDYVEVLSDYRVPIVMMQYSACFGTELTMNAQLATHFRVYFQMASGDAALLASSFGMMNLFARSLGGVASDFLYARYNLRGRLFAQFLCLFLEACFLFAFGCVDNKKPWPVALFVLVLFSVSVQMAEGTTYGIVPSLQARNLSYVSALVGAGGNMGAVIALWCFHKTLGPTDPLLPFKVHAAYVLVSALLTPLLSQPDKRAAVHPAGAVDLPEPTHVLPVEFPRQVTEGSDASALLETPRKGALWRERPGCDGTEIDGSLQLSTSGWPTQLKMPEKQKALVVAEPDRGTRDEWVRRHPDMVRLTGRHPFNSEPPLKKLQEAGWVTPASITFVRNHGAVPRLSWETHRLHISGVPQTCEVTMDELATGRLGSPVTIPVTYICSGNRRKEQNMTKKTIGFNWGPSAVANGVWTGVRLCDVLARVGISRMSAKHQFVHFAGPKGEVPQGSDGTYGTSIPIGWALDRERDVLLAFKHNGEHLLPDHGFPLRVLLPGGTGARMIKWLSQIWVSDRPSENHYHFFDNRVLPPHVDAGRAEAEGWWYKPEYIINHININSAIFEPRHNAFFPLKGAAAHPTMKVSGYAYVGGGTKIIRAEISLDGGRSWELADLTRPEDDIAAARGTDKHWCWSLWETEIAASRMSTCREICCRAVDANQNSQPSHLVWNVMGMMNNCVFRVKVHPWTDAAGASGVWFEHPTMPGNEQGGWMTEDSGRFDPEQASLALPGPKGVALDRLAIATWGAGAEAEAEAPGLLTSKRPAKPAEPAKSEAMPAGRLVTSRPEWLEHGIPMAEVCKHSTEQSAWIAVKGRVYDCTPYLDEHPGGAMSIMLAAGQDATEDFEAVHSEKAWEKLRDYYIGPLRAEGALPTAAAAPAPGESAFLKATAQAIPLIKKIVVSHDTRIFRFGLPTPTTRLGLPTGMHLLIKATINGLPVLRSYTPMTDDATLGHVDLLVKVYFAGVHPRFPEGGKMSQHLESLRIGDTIDVKGPIGNFVYQGLGSFAFKGKPRECKRISLIAGGTGLTPCYQVLAAVLKDPGDTTELRLVYANNTPGDILLRSELDRLAKEQPDRFQVWYTVASVPPGTDWTYDVGFVTLEMMEARLFPGGEGTIAMICGPPPMTQAAGANLQKLGYQEKDLMVM